MDNIYSRISVFLFIFPTVFCAIESPNDICSSVKVNTTCIVVTSCPYVTKLLSAENRDIDPITKLNCGYEGTHTKVCCPKNEEIPIVYNTTEENSTNRPKRISTLKPKVTSTTAPHITEQTNIAVPSKVFCDKISGSATELPNDPVMTNATCVKLTSCPYALQLLNEDTMNIKTIIKLNCGIDDKHPKVCCPKEKIQISYDTTEIGANTPKITTTVKPKATSTIAPHIPEKTNIEFPSKTLCGKGIETSYRIYGGTITELDEHPWLARIGYKIDNVLVFGCSATLITDRYLLTAAHCVTKNRPITIVRLGEWNTKTETDCYKNICNNGTIDVKVSKIRIHPTFNQSKGADSDIALIQLEQAVTFTEFIRPICLPTSKYIALQDYSHDSAYITAGWGLTEFESESDVKRQVELKAAPIEVCRNIYKLKAESEPNIICAGGTKGKDTCRGDSGGPLIKEVPEDYQINWYVFGIISQGLGNCGAEGVPGIYTRVSVYMDWIRAVVSS